MKKATDILPGLILSFLALLTFSCEENEPEIMGIEPFFNIRFINQDSISKLDNSIDLINDELQNIADSLVAIDSLENNNEDANYTANKESLNDQKKLLTTDRTNLNKIITLIKTGKVKISSLKGQNSAGTITYQDSLTSYNFPLNTHADFSRFIITIADIDYSLDVLYSRETVEQERDVLIKALNFDVIEYAGFDSVKISQRDSINYSSNEATVTAYF